MRRKVGNAILTALMLLLCAASALLPAQRVEAQSVESPQVKKDVPTLYVVSIGVDDYGGTGYPNLGGAVNDAMAVTDTLSEYGKNLFGEVRVARLLDDEATRANVQRAIQDVIQTAQPEDVFIFHFSGHGGELRDSLSQQMEDGSRHFLVLPGTVSPVGSMANDEVLASHREKSISARLLTTWLNVMPARNQLLVLDAGMGGSLFDTFVELRQEQQRKEAELTAGSLAALSVYGPAYERKPHDESVFGQATTVFLDGIVGEADASGDENGVSTMTEIGQFYFRHLRSADVGSPAFYLRGRNFPLSADGSPGARQRAIQLLQGSNRDFNRDEYWSVQQFSSLARSSEHVESDSLRYQQVIQFEGEKRQHTEVIIQDASSVKPNWIRFSAVPRVFDPDSLEVEAQVIQIQEVSGIEPHPQIVLPWTYNIEKRQTRLSLDFQKDGTYTLKVEARLGGVPWAMGNYSSISDWREQITNHRFLLGITTISPDTTAPRIAVDSAFTAIALTGRVRDGGDVERLEVNGIPVAPRSDGTFEVPIRAVSGQDSVRISATDAAGNVQQKVVSLPSMRGPMRSRVVSVGGRVDNSYARTGRNVALLFAGSEYEHWDDLRNPLYDAKAIGEELDTHYDFDVRLIKDPTRRQMLDTLSHYATHLDSEDDRLLIFFAGHGGYDERNVMDGYVAARDTRDPEEDIYKDTAVPYNWLRRRLGDAQTGHILLVLDVCYGGTFDRRISDAEMRGDDPMYEDVGRLELIRRTMEHRTRRYLTSGGVERVPDGRPGEHSPFARRFLEALRSYGGDDGILTLSEIKSRIEKIEPEPRAGEFDGNEPGSDFPFIVDRIDNTGSDAGER